jgi:hypothetical protein
VRHVSNSSFYLIQGVKDEYASDWYKAWVKKMHKFDRPHTQEDEPIRVKLKSTKYKGRGIHSILLSKDFNSSYFIEVEFPVIFQLISQIIA